MDRFKNKYRIPSARANWHGYDGGVYFVTICTKNREHYLGEISHPGNSMNCRDAIALNCRDAINRVSTGATTATTMPEPQMKLSPIGQYAHEQFVNVKMHYPYAEIPLFVVMPNHIHAIVMIDGNKDTDVHRSDAMNCGDAINCSGGITGNNNPMLQKCLGMVIRGLKARITHYSNQNNIPFAWQSRFYDRIVRNQNELNRIAEYIENNVANWQLDELYKME